ncbi:3-hydroxy-3-methylglutaryl-coenzyme A reductase-like [Sycon ciliatum]|uniref:3-hydroxy-3-methylglutaryl-coenzyme A reductase-like n=1 Tax=Sycon ciliatum TaxID=27933 RepID=UPI0031F67997
MALSSAGRMVDSSFGSLRDDKVSTPLFRACGRFCASRPAEVVVSTILFGIGVGSVAVRHYGMPQKTAEGVCDAGTCDELMNAEIVTADVILATLLRCIAVLYTYMQFCNFNRLGSKYLLGLACAFSIAFSFLIAAAVAQYFNVTILRATDAIPIFMLLIDLSRALRLAKYALKAKSQDEIKERIGDGLAVVVPSLALDTLVEVLIIGVGTYARQPLQSVCLFGCASLVASFLLFITFFPAALALTMEVSKSAEVPAEAFSGFSLHHLTSTFLAEEEDCKANPVTQNIKLVMSLGLGFVHAFNWVIKPVGGDFASMGSLLDSSRGVLQPAADRLPVISTDSHSLPQLFGLAVDQWLPLGLFALLLLKYIALDATPSVRASSEGRSSMRRGSSLFDLWHPSAASLRASEVHESAAQVDCVDGAAQSIKHVPECCADERASAVEEVIPVEPTPAEELPASGTRPLFTIGTPRSSSSDPEEDEVLTAASPEAKEPRSLEECLRIKTEHGCEQLIDEEVLLLLEHRKIAAYRLETELSDCERAVRIRRVLVSPSLASNESLELLPFSGYNYQQVQGACCENVIGYMPIPVGVAGPLLLDGQLFQVPMATTEGCLVASTNRGCRALQKSNGVHSTLTGDSMTRAPALRLPSAQRAGVVKMWLEDQENFQIVKKEFDSTSSFGRLEKLLCIQAGCTLFVRFAARTGDAMGMNMVSKGVEKSVRYLRDKFTDLEVLSLSGNVCTDKKPSAINWIMGRGKSVVAEATLSAAVVKEVLKTNALSLVELNRQKNLVGSAMAGSIGGFNAHAANIVAAVFIATGQDAAQSGTSSLCITQMELCGPRDEDLYITCTMPGLEIGTVGGGTILSPQAACLKMLGVQGANRQNPGQNATQLARVICATVLAGELSLMAALASGDLVKSHMRHNRSLSSITPIKEH